MTVLLISVAVLSLAVITEAATTDRTVFTTADAAIAGSTSMSISPGTITYGVTSGDAFPTVPADKKVVITYASNYDPWKLSIYTDNTQVPNFTDTNGDGVAESGRYAKGGLATANGLHVVPCKWVAKVGTIASPPILAVNAGGYNFVKDKRDEDDPATTVDDNGTPADPSDDIVLNESWAFAFAAGYTNIAYGNPGGGFCVDPTNTAPADPLNKFKGDAVNGSVAVFIAAGFGTSWAETPVPAAAGTYSSKIYFDLYHE